MWLRVVLCPCQLRAIKLSLAALSCINEYGGRRVGKKGRGVSQEMSQLLFFLILIGHMGAEEGPTCMTMRRSKTRMKEARKARETSSLGRKPRFRLSQLIQSVLMTKTTTDVREMSTVLHRAEEREGGTSRHGEENKEE